MNTNQETQLTQPTGYDVSNLILSDVVDGEIPDSRPKIEFKRINISTKNADGTVGELIIPTSRLFSFGVSENVSMETGKVTGYTFPLCLWDRDGPTPAERAWTDTFDRIVDAIVDHLVEVREDIDMFDLTKADLVKSKGGLNPLYWKKEKVRDPKTGKMVMRPVPGTGPTLYAKLMHSRKTDKFSTLFFGVNDEPIDPLDLMGKHCHAEGAVKIESIFIGAKISLQVKLYEAVVEPRQSARTRLLRPVSRSQVIAAKKSSASSMLAADNSGSDSNGSISSDDDDESFSVRRTVKTTR
jgi:hypothetical protein